MSDYDDPKYFGGRVIIGRNREKENSSSVTGFLRLINNNSQSSPDTETMKETDGKQDETLPWTKRQKTKRQKQKTQKDKNGLARHGYNERSG